MPSRSLRATQWVTGQASVMASHWPWPSVWDHLCAARLFACRGCGALTLQVVSPQRSPSAGRGSGMSQQEQYLDLFRDRFGIKTWIPAWHPGADIRVGMAGRIDEGEFIYAYNVTDRGVKLPDPPPPDAHPDDYEWVTERSASLSVKAAGETDQAFKGVAKAEVGFKLDFTNESGMAVVLREITEQRAGDERAIAVEMVESWNGGPWPKMEIGDVVVTQTMVAGWGFAYGGSDSGGSVVIKTDASIGSGDSKIGDIKGKIGVAFQQKTGFKALSAGGLTIAYRCLELRQKGWFFKRTVAKPRYKSIIGDENEDELIIPRRDFPAPYNEL